MKPETKTMTTDETKTKTKNKTKTKTNREIFFGNGKRGKKQGKATQLQ